MKLDFDIESNVLEWVSELGPTQCLIVSDYEGSDNYTDTINVLETILKKGAFDRWKDNSASNLPPDFINEEDGLMMEIMRFDDHSPNGKKNPNLARQRQMSKELEPLMHLFPNVKHVITNAVTDLPTEEDHNYRFYCDGFKRTVTKHSAKISSYRKNHPGKKLVFLVADESSGVYFERVLGMQKNAGRPHLPFFDNRLLKTFEKEDIDYLLLFCPFNYCECIDGALELPKLVIFDVKHMNSGSMLQHIDYDEEMMTSNEL